MKTTIFTSIPTLCIINWMLAIHPASSQQSTESSKPTVPESGIGGPKAVDLEAQDEGKNNPMGTIPRGDLSIMEIVSGAADFTTLTAALRATGQDQTLKGEGSFTLLAPSNDAFSKLPEGVLPMLLKPENRELLQKILTYHLIPRKIQSTEMVPGNYLSSQGENLTIEGGGAGKSTVQGASFGLSDVAARNGTIHVVNAVLIPPSVTIEDQKPATSP